MASPTLYYVDPNAGVDATGGGAGGISAPWKSVQYALNHITRNATNGDQVNVKAGTADVLTATLSLTTYGTPSATAPLVFRGYTAAAGDLATAAYGGLAEIGGGAGNFTILTTSAQGVYFADLRLRNTGTAYVLQFNSDGKIGVDHCEVCDSTGGGIGLNNGSGNYNFQIFNCYFHDVTGAGLGNGSGGQILFLVAVMNYFKNGSSRKFTDCIYAGSCNTLLFNLFDLDGSSCGVHWTRAGCVVMNNLAYSAGGTGKGYYCDDGANDNHAILLNNYAEGFTGTGGKGYSLISGSKQWLAGANYAFNSATNFSTSGDKLIDLGAQTALGSSPLTNPAGEDFSVSTALKALGLPASFLGGATSQHIDVGGPQRQEPSGSSGPTYFAY